MQAESRLRTVVGIHVLDWYNNDILANIIIVAYQANPLCCSISGKPMGIMRVQRQRRPPGKLCSPLDRFLNNR